MSAMQELEDHVLLKWCSWGGGMSIAPSLGGSLFLRRLRDYGLRGCARSKTMRCLRGWMTVGDFLLYADVAARTWSGGVAAAFCLAAPAGGGNPDHFVIVRKHILRSAEDTPTSWLYEPALDWVVMHGNRIVHIAPTVQDGRNVRVLLPLHAGGFF